MNTPFILITYGFSQRLFSFEKNGVCKLPVFGEPVLASLFVSSAKESMADLLTENLEIQICNNKDHAIDMFKMISIVSPNAKIVFNPAPLTDNPEREIQKVAKEFSSAATTINREYDLDEWQEILESPDI